MWERASWISIKKLCIAAGIRDIDMNGKFVAIKMHFGELGNLAFLRPNYAKAVADLCKEQGGMPFLTDCNTLYPGSRKNALEHLDCANLNGFNTITTGCQIIIGMGCAERMRWKSRLQTRSTAGAEDWARRDGCGYFYQPDTF